MPIYEYVHQIETTTCKKVIEVFQAMSDSPLEVCPYCHEPVRKIISQIGGVQESEKDKYSNKNLSRLGFTKYEKRGDGTYEKTAGSSEAPQTLDKRRMEANMDYLGV